MSRLPEVTTGSEEPIVLYIGGYGRSGSTILDMLLGLNRLYISAGELTHVFRDWQALKLCSCGQLWQECDYWGPVQRRFHEQLPDISIAEAENLTRKSENILRLNLSARSLRVKYGRVWKVLLRAMLEESGAVGVIDSSKTAIRASGNRALLLGRLANADVRMLHLVRDPRAVIWSVLRGSNRNLEAGDKASIPFGATRALAGWTAANVLARANSRIAGIPYQIIRYEDLVADPSPELRLIGETLLLDLQPIVRQLGRGSSIPHGHGIAGNRLRREGAQKLREDNEWRIQLPTGARALSWLAWPIARRYGYRVFQK